MNSELNKLKSIIQSRENVKSIIEILSNYDTEIDIEDGTPLNHAINYDRNEIVKYLINRGANVNALYKGDYSPLMSAVEGNNLEMITLLLESDANVHLVDKHGNDALWKAVFNNNLEIVKLLVEAGADPFKEIIFNKYDNRGV